MMVSGWWLSLLGAAVAAPRVLKAWSPLPQVPEDAEARILNLMEASRAADALQFSRRTHMGIGLVVFNAALNAIMALG